MGCGVVPALDRRDSSEGVTLGMQPRPPGLISIPAGLAEVEPLALIAGVPGRSSPSERLPWGSQGGTPPAAAGQLTGTRPWAHQTGRTRAGSCRR